MTLGLDRNVRRDQQRLHRCSSATFSYVPDLGRPGEDLDRRVAKLHAAPIYMLGEHQVCIDCTRGRTMSSILLRQQRDEGVSVMAGEWPEKHNGVGSTRMILEDSLHELSRVRNRVRTLLAGRLEQFDSKITDAVFVADKLAATSFRYGLPPREARLRLTAGGACLRIEVNAAVDPQFEGLFSFTAEGTRNRGLLDRLAAGWGSQRDGQGMTVWAELDLVS